MLEHRDFFATAPKGIEPLLVDELIQLGAEGVKQSRGGATFTGTIETAYRACLWLRTANRVLLPIKTFPANNPEELYNHIYEVDWNEHLEPNGTLLVDFNCSQSEIKHSHFGALKVKDAIVDQFRNRFSIRPSVEVNLPDLRVNVHLLKNIATLSIDLSGDSLHRRGYRESGQKAPLKENLAAAILIKAGWPEIAKQGGGLIDPMCGSGTLPIEAALIAANSAPGLLRDHFGFLNWRQHQPDVWEKLLNDAEQQESEGLLNIPFIAGYDASSNAVHAAIQACEKAGLTTKVHFEKQEFADCVPHAQMKDKPGLFICNPPYGVRLGEISGLEGLYKAIGNQLKQHFPDWNASIFTGNTELGKSIGLRAHKKTVFYNGAIHCNLLNYHIHTSSAPSDPEKPRITKDAPEKVTLDKDMQMLANRIQKNRKKLSGWLKKEKVSCFRIYDKDIPEFAFSIDLYDRFATVQEYKAPDSVDPDLARKRIDKVIRHLPGILNLPKHQIFFKLRSKQKGNRQYQKTADNSVFHEVVENGCKFLVNFDNYLDSGLFLDHRITRKLVGDLCTKKHFLNLFSYTGSATVYAAKAGAKSTVSVDTSKTYLNWSKKNLALNGFSETKNRFYQADCLQWLDENNFKFDIIFLDPPTFSNNKRTNTIFDVQKDHVRLIQSAMRSLNHQGTLIFSNNYRKFKMDRDALKDFAITEITSNTIPPDFSRSPKIHNCWQITF